jgi:hypothetical protein
MMKGTSQASCRLTSSVPVRNANRMARGARSAASSIGCPRIQLSVAAAATIAAIAATVIDLATPALPVNTTIPASAAAAAQAM